MKNEKTRAPSARWAVHNNGNTWQVRAYWSEGTNDAWHSVIYEGDESSARLIAAAPDLLAAAKEAAKFMPSGSTPYNVLWDAILKAEGK